MLVWLLSDLGVALDQHDCRGFLDCDNLLAACKEEATASMIDTLVREFLAGHRAGPFRLHDEEHANANNGVTHFGYTYSHRDDVVRIEPTEAGYDRIYRRLADAYKLSETERNVQELEDALVKSVSGHNAWTEKQDFIDSARHLYPEFYGPVDAAP